MAATRTAPSGRKAFPDDGPDPSPAISAARRASRDGSIKHLIRLTDGSEVEAVFLPSKDRRTLCVSSQVGCALDCSFCATGRLGFRRNLSAVEIFAQGAAVLRASEPLPAVPGQLPEAAPATLTNVVFMGMGEPFYNYENVLRAADMFADPHGPAIAPRRITISTAGILPQIERYFREDRPYKLAISITSALSAKRDALMPINRRFSLEDLRTLLATSPARAVRRVMIEIPLLAGVNDGAEDCEALLKFCAGLPVRVNLIPWNPVALGPAFVSPDRDRVLAFQSALRRDGLPVFIRRSLGSDIQGACGQLAGGVQLLRNPAGAESREARPPSGEAS